MEALEGVWVAMHGVGKWVVKEAGLQGIEGNGFGGWMEGGDVGRGDGYDDGDDGVWKLK